MGMAKSVNELDNLARIAWKYYHEGMTQQEIADEFGVSRFKIMNLISEAREKGLIKIQFVNPIFNCMSIESKLKERYGLKDAVVIPAPSNQAELKNLLGIAGSNYLQKNIAPGDRLGTAWGGTVMKVAEHFAPQKMEDVTVVLLHGGLSHQSISLNPFDVAQKMAHKLECQCYFIFSPVIVDSEEIYRVILSDGKIKAALEMANSVNKALVGIGDVSTNAVLVKTNFISPDQMVELKRKGAVGDILGRYFDIEGKPVDCEINKRIIGLGLDRVKEIEEVIGVAGGGSKLKAIQGALKGDYLDVLITDEKTAGRLLK